MKNKVVLTSPPSLRFSAGLDGIRVLTLMNSSLQFVWVATLP